jgi:signal peptidase
MPADIRVGDIIVYKLPGSSIPTLHRVVSLEEQGGVIKARTKGDNNQTVDPTEILLTGRGSRVVYSVPYVGYILHAPRQAWSQNLFLRLPALALAAYVLWSIWKPARKQQPAPVALPRSRGVYKPFA